MQISEVLHVSYRVRAKILAIKMVAIVTKVMPQQQPYHHLPCHQLAFRVDAQLGETLRIKQVVKSSDETDEDIKSVTLWLISTSYLLPLRIKNDQACCDCEEHRSSYIFMERDGWQSHSQ